MTSREEKRRNQIKRDIITGILDLNNGESLNFAPEALKQFSNIPVSSKVLNEIIKDNIVFRDIDKSTGTTGVTDFLVKVKYKFETTGGLSFKAINLGGVDLEITSKAKTVKGVEISTNNMVWLTVKTRGRNTGSWTFTAVKITQKLPDSEKTLTMDDSPIETTVGIDKNTLYKKLKKLT